MSGVQNSTDHGGRCTDLVSQGLDKGGEVTSRLPCFST